MPSSSSSSVDPPLQYSPNENTYLTVTLAEGTSVERFRTALAEKVTSSGASDGVDDGLDDDDHNNSSRPTCMGSIGQDLMAKEVVVRVPGVPSQDAQLSEQVQKILANLNEMQEELEGEAQIMQFRTRSKR